MSNSGLDLMTDGPSDRGPGRGRRRSDSPRRKPWGRRIVALLVVLAVVAGLGWVALEAKDRFFSSAADYSGQGTGDVTVEIPQGADGMAIARILADKGVVKSADAFYQLALEDSRFPSVQAGFFSLKKKMSAKAAMGALVDKGNRVEGRVTIPEGARVDQVVQIVSSKTDITTKQLEAALDAPDKLGLPAVAKGNPEGYLYPATYTVEPGETAASLLQQMVAKTLAVAKDLDIGTRADALGYSGEEILTIASILEYEAKADEDYAKVARVLYNRLDAGMPLQLDSTVSYVSGRKGDVFTTEEERNAESAYNTYQNPGLPPGPIGSPGEKTIEAALNPAEGNWLFFVAVNLETGETVFSDTFGEHNKAVEQLKEYCKTAPDGVCGAE